MLTPTQRSLRSRVAAHRLHATHDSKELTAPARQAFNARFEAEVDPDGVLPEEERARRVEQARRAYFAQLAYRSAVVRSRKAAK